MKISLRPLALLLAAVPGYAAAQSNAPADAPPTGEAGAFQARMVVTLSDADMVPSAYIDGKLGPASGSDALTILRLDDAGLATDNTVLPISNSVTGPPSAFAVTPDGRYAIVVETLGARPADKPDAMLTDLQPGRTISVVDLAAPDGPAVVQEVCGPSTADSVSISSDGSLVAISVRPTGDGAEAPLWLYRLRDGRLDEGLAPTIPGWTKGNRLIDAAFHPSQPILALVDETGLSVTLFEINGETRALTQWGNKVAIERGPYLARFTPDGRYLLLTATFTDVTPRSGENAFPRGTAFSIRLDSQKDEQGAPQHIVASRAMTGFVPEGLTISPDGRYAVTVNLERTSYAPEDPRFRPFGSLTLLTIEPQTGELRQIGDFPFDGILPESAAFDRSGRMLAVANYGKPYDLVGNGSVDFWRLVEDPEDPARTKLVRTEQAVPVQRGAHVIAVVP